MRLINSISAMEKYLQLLYFTDISTAGNIPEQFLRDLKKGIDAATFGIRLRFLNEVKENLPEYYNYFVEREEENEEKEEVI